MRAALVLLTLTALMKLHTALGTARALEAEDLVFPVRQRTLFLVVGVMELLIANYLAFGPSRFVALCAVAWLATNFAVYRLVAALSGAQACPCLGYALEGLGLSPATGKVLSLVIMVFLLAGSWGLVLTWPRGRERQASANAGATPPGTAVP